MQTLTLQAWPSLEQDTAPNFLAGKPGPAGHTHTHTHAPLVERCAEFFAVFKATLDACGESGCGHSERGLLWRAALQAARSDSSLLCKSLQHSARSKGTPALGHVQPVLELLAALPESSLGAQFHLLNHLKSFHQWQLPGLGWTVRYWFPGIMADSSFESRE